MSDGRSGRDREKAAIVTAAGSGMGAACARELASRGYAVALMSPSNPWPAHYECAVKGC